LVRRGAVLLAVPGHQKTLSVRRDRVIGPAGLVLEQEHRLSDPQNRPGVDRRREHLSAPPEEEFSPRFRPLARAAALARYLHLHRGVRTRLYVDLPLA